MCAVVRRPTPDAAGQPSSAVSPTKAGDAPRQSVRAAPPKPQRPEPDVQDDEEADGDSDGMSDDGDQDVSLAPNAAGSGSSNAANNDAPPSPDCSRACSRVRQNAGRFGRLRPRSGERGYDSTRPFPAS